MHHLALTLVDPSPLPNVDTHKTISNGFSIFYEVIGAVAILLIVIAALRYMLAGSDANKVSEAKKMIAYTLVGLVVIILAGAIIQFVIKAKP